MAHQYMPKIFHDPPQNPSGTPPTYLMFDPLTILARTVYYGCFVRP